MEPPGLSQALLLNQKKPKNPKNAVNPKNGLGRNFVCFPHMINWLSNLFFTNKIDVFSCPNHYHSTIIHGRVLGLKNAFMVPFWFFFSWIWQKWARWAVWSKPQHVRLKTELIYSKRVPWYSTSHSMTSERFSVNPSKCWIFAYFSPFGAFWFSGLNQTPYEFVCLPKIFFWTTKLHKFAQKKFQINISKIELSVPTSRGGGNSLFSPPGFSNHKLANFDLGWIQKHPGSEGAIDLFSDQKHFGLHDKKGE